MRLTKRQIKRIIKEEYSKIKRQQKLLSESHDIAAEIWANNGEGTDYGQNLLDALNRAQSSGHLEAMTRYNEELKDTMIDIDHECDMNNISTATVLSWIRQSYCPKGLTDWYSLDPNEPGAYKRKYGFFDG